MAKKQIQNKSMTAVSLFSGGGGMDVGVLRAGFNVLACVELDPNACETLRENIRREKRKTVVYEEDVRQLEPEKLMADLKLKPGELDLLCGGPPCQSFSQIGKQKSLNDERGLLLFQMARFARILKPKAILIEQVKGLLTAPDLHGIRGGVFQQLIKELEGLEYVPKWAILNAAEYGVAQLRKRVFIASTMKPNGFQFPEATHSEHNEVGTLFPRPSFKTVGEVLRGLGRPSLKSGRPRDDSHVDVTPDNDRRRIHGVPEGLFLASQVNVLPKEQIRNLSKKDTTKYLRLGRNKPSNTLRCGEIFFHPTADRYLTPREYMRIHGYPDEYVLKGPIRSRSGRVRDLDQHRQVANSVPPPLAFVLACEIKRVIECRKSLNCLASH